MRAAALLTCLLLAACYAPTPPTGARCADGVCPSGLVCASATQTCELTEVDAGGDGALPDANDPLCHGTGIVRVCLQQAPVNAVTFGIAETLDTTTSSRCVPYTTPTSAAWCVVAATDIVIDAPLAVTGARPLVLLATSRLTVMAPIDAASHHDGRTGPGANPAVCDAGAAALDTGGGAGGSFGGAGGDGGSSGRAASTAGTPASTITLRGGCAGTNGATTFQTGAAVGGAGGGALYLLAGESIMVGAALDASGAGGGTPTFTTSGGGGGGGSGGLIGLEAPMITGAGEVFANGGGGAGGSKVGGSGGTNGADPQNAITPAAGGSPGCGNCGRGGAGAAGLNLAGVDGTSTANSGGGGGGGAGVILIVPAQALAGTVSPPPR